MKKKKKKKSKNYFLNLATKQAEKSTIQRWITDKKYFIKHNDINNNERTNHIDKLDHNTLLQSIILSSVTNDQKVVCDNDLTNKELFDALKGIP